MYCRSGLDPRLLVLFLVVIVPNSFTLAQSGSSYETRGSVGLTGNVVDVHGSENKYRTDYNYRSGFSLEDFTFELIGAAPDHTRLDFLSLSGFGFGGAYPYQQAELRFGNHGAYEFYGRYWRQISFFNVPDYAQTGLSRDSARQVTDLGLTIHPHQKISVDVGYQHNYQYGTNFSSNDYFLNLYEMTDPRRALTQDFRIGVTARPGRTTLSVFQNFRWFKEDPDRQENRLLEPGTLPEVDVDRPTRITIPSTRFLAAHSWSRVELEGAYIYSDGHAETTTSELISLELGQDLTLDKALSVASVSDRPDHRGRIGLTAILTDRINFSQHFGFHTFDVGGIAAGEQRFQGNAPNAGELVFPLEGETSWDYSIFRSQSQAEFWVNPRFSFFGGYRYADRSIEDRVASETSDRRTHMGLGGFAWKPYSGARLNLSFEEGSSDTAFVETEARRRSAWRITGAFPISEGFLVLPRWTLIDERNRTSDYDGRLHQLGVDLQYQQRDGRWTITGGYQLFDMDTFAPIRFLFEDDLVEDVSLYTSRLHYTHARFQIPLGRLFDLRIGGRWLKDGDGNSFPLERINTEAGVLVYLGEQVDLDVLWRHVSYNETNATRQDYGANHLAFTVRWRY